MGDYCTIADVWQQIKIDEGEMKDSEVEKRITEAEQWVNAYQRTTYSSPVDDLIKYATATYAASLVYDFLFTALEPNQSSQAKVLRMRAKEYLDNYAQDTFDPESGVEKINSGFFDNES